MVYWTNESLSCVKEISVFKLCIEKPNKIVKYADDTTFIILQKTENSNEVAVITNHFINWCSGNDLVLNNTKTQSICIQNKSSLSKKNKESIKLLGMYIQNDLKWDRHINYITRKCNSRLYILRKMKSMVNKNQQINLFNGLISSLLEYGCSVYGKLRKLDENKLDKIINRAHKTICGVNCKNKCLSNFHERQIKLSTNLLLNIEKNENHILHNFIPKRFKRSKHFLLENITSTRRENQFFPFMSLTLNSLREKMSNHS